MGGPYPVQPWLSAGPKTLSDRGALAGSGTFACDLSAGVGYDGASHALLLDGTTRANATLGAAAAAWLQDCFTAVTDVRPLAAGGNATLWELSGAAGQAPLALRIEGARYVLRYGAANVALGPYAAAGARRALLVRCSPGRLLCTLT